MTTPQLTPKGMGVWGNTRIIIIDTETTRGPEGGDVRTVQYGCVVARSKGSRQTHEWLVNPECSIDTASTQIHSITDQMVDGEPSFTELADTIFEMWEPAGQEPVVIAGFNLGYDLAVLNQDAERAGRTLPVVPALDAWRLAQHLGLRPADGLRGLAVQLGVTNPKPHSAGSDATATADILVHLFNRAAESHQTIAELIEALGGHTTGTLRASISIPTGRRSQRYRPPPEHSLAHDLDLYAAWDAEGIEIVTEAITECARERCHRTRERLTQSGVNHTQMMLIARDAIDSLIANGEWAAAATLLPAAMVLFDRYVAYLKTAKREEARMTWATRVEEAVRDAPRCTQTGNHVWCPGCRRSQPCGLDSWQAAAVASANDRTKRWQTNFLRPTPSAKHRDKQEAWIERDYNKTLIGVETWNVLESLLANGDIKNVIKYAERTWERGIRDPNVTEVLAVHLASRGTPAAIREAINRCEETLQLQGSSTSWGWAVLRTRRAALAGRLQHLQGRQTGDYDEDGSPIYQRSHAGTYHRPKRAWRFKVG